MNSYEEFLAMVKLFGHPKEVEARIKSITDKQKALDDQVAELAAGRDDLANAKKAFEADVKAWKKRMHDALAAEAKAEADKVALAERSAQLELRTNKLAENERAYLDGARLLNEKGVALNEREELLKKREAELVAKLAEVNDRLARMKAAVV